LTQAHDMFIYHTYEVISNRTCKTWPGHLVSATATQA